MQSGPYHDIENSQRITSRRESRNESQDSLFPSFRAQSGLATANMPRNSQTDSSALLYPSINQYFDDLNQIVKTHENGGPKDSGKPQRKRSYTYDDRMRSLIQMGVESRMTDHESITIRKIMNY